MKFFFQAIDRGLAIISIWLIYLYQYTLSPDKGIFSFFLRGKVCSHEPHCSEYGIRVLKRYGFIEGLGMISDRVLSCKPRLEKMYDPECYRVVFFSSAEIGVSFFKELMNDKRFEVVGVVTQEDKPVGRGLKMTPNIIKQVALENGISSDAVYTPTKINPEKSLEGKAFYDWLIEKGADYFVVIAYGKILPQVILDIPIFGSINVHGSLLPKYRGASPLQTVFLNDEEVSGITIMHMDAGMDTGNIIDKLAFKIPFDWTVRDLIQAFEDKGPEFLAGILWDYAKGSIKEIEQDESKAILCNKIVKEDGKIDAYKDPLEDIYNKYRGYVLWPKIWFILNDKKVVIEELILDEVRFNELKDKSLFDKANKLNDAVKSILLKPEGKKAMDYKSFKNGYLK